MRQSLLSKIVLVAGVGFLLFNIGWSWKNSRGSDVAGTSDQYPLLAKRIFVDNPNDIFINFVPLRKELERKFSTLSGPRSFYFEYLPDGTSIRIGEDTELVAASLLKLPLVMNLYRAAELGRIDLDQAVEIKPGQIDDGFGDLWMKGAGTKLTLREAAEQTLTKSDNTAANVIADNIENILSSDEMSYSQLDIDASFQDGKAVIRAKSYASILKCLYFTCYLTRQDANELLTYLAESVDQYRLARPIPKEITIAHKIGVFGEKLSESDCGIVYVPRRPYLVCAMVSLPEEQANTFIAEVSGLIYDWISKLN